MGAVPPQIVPPGMAPPPQPVLPVPNMAPPPPFQFSATTHAAQNMPHVHPQQQVYANAGQHPQQQQQQQQMMPQMTGHAHTGSQQMGHMQTAQAQAQAMAQGAYGQYPAGYNR